MTGDPYRTPAPRVLRLDEKAALDFAYGNLMCSTRHAPPRRAFAELARKRGWSDEDFAAWARRRKWAS